MVVALLLERVIFHFLPEEFMVLLFSGEKLNSLKDAFIIFFISFAVIALIEEIVKYEVLYTFTSRMRTCDQIIDYVKLGIAVGLGFATVENVYYFLTYHWDKVLVVTAVFVSRFFLATLAHILYGALLGYYLGHAACNKVYEKSFIRKGIVSAVLLHGLFNFSVFTGAAFYNVFLVLGVLVVIIKWFKDRRLLERAVIHKELDLALRPVLPDQLEIKNFFSFSSLSDEHRHIILKKISFCPYCLSRLPKGVEFCVYCKKKIDR